MVQLRPYRTSDLDALYEICLVTADSGRDASPQHNDRKIIGHIYAAPYGVLEPHNVFVAEDELGVAGYIVGTADSDAFSAKLESQWWPELRQYYSSVAPTALTDGDRRRLDAIINPSDDPRDIVDAYPAHIHMNLLPRLRGQGVGTGLLNLWTDQARAAGVTGIHLGANPGNSGGIAFWTRSGFEPLLTNARTAWFGMTL